MTQLASERVLGRGNVDVLMGVDADDYPDQRVVCDAGHGCLSW